MDYGTDVIVVGGGVIGLTIAWELAGQDATVRVVERGVCGGEASWAGAGMILPGNSDRAESPEAQLRALSFERWPSLSAELLEETGLDNQFHPTGGLEVRTASTCAALETEVSNWRNEGITAQLMPLPELQDFEPALSDKLLGGYRLPEMSQVRNPRHLKALRAACLKRGMRIEEHCEATDLKVESGVANAVHTPKQTFFADNVCICAGAWSQRILDSHLEPPPHIEPVRGQMVLLGTNPPELSHIVQEGSRYIVPRKDGHVLIGSTQEFVGFEKQTTEAAIAGLIEFVSSIVPELANAPVKKTWAGLRPGSQRGLPFMGAIPDTSGLYIAAGHFRNGLQNSAGTGLFMRDLILHGTRCLETDAFEVRHASTARN